MGLFLYKVQTNNLQSALAAFNKQSESDASAMYVIGYEIVRLTSLLNLSSLQELQLRRKLFDFSFQKNGRRTLYSSQSLENLPALKRAEKYFTNHFTY